MPNLIGPTGLQVATDAEITQQLTTAFETIYGVDINVSSDTPDGQIIGIFKQAVLDLEDLLVQIYNGFDPDNANGVVLDQRVAINGIQRQAGTRTLTNITLVIDRALSLFGADQSTNPVFTVADNAGNEWQLITTQSPAVAGTYVYPFQAKNPGAVLTTPNTITIPVTIVLGVTSINNPTTYSTLGINEESDAELKIRRQKSVSLASQGYLSGLLAALENLNGITAAFVYENTTAVTDGDGIPGHSIWVIVNGTAAPADIARAIYNKRNAGCGMKGTQIFVIVQADGTPFSIRWDFVVPQNLFIRFTATSLDGINPPNLALIRSQLPILFVPGVNEEVNINGLATIVQQIDPNTLVTAAGFSLAATGPFTDTLQPSAKNRQFAVSSANSILLPLIMVPASAAVGNGNTQQFSALGGFGAYTFTLQVNNSGGSCTSGGLYTAGAVDSIDTVRVTDALGNFKDALVTVS